VRGRIVLTGSTTELRGSDAVIDLYLGHGSPGDRPPPTLKCSAV
jgi:hypothetical protein